MQQPKRPMKSLLLPIAMACLFADQSGVFAQAISVPLRPATQQFNLSTSTSSYRLGPGDQIEVNVFGVPELTTSRVILADGTANLPIIGSVRLNGLSQEEAAAELTDMYRPYNDKLQITVAVTNPRPMTISILGEVNRPGPYTLQSQSGSGGQSATTKQGTGEGTSGNTGGGRLTVSQALNLAGGVTSDADVEEITLIRKLPGGRNTRSKVNLWALLQNGDTAQDIPMLDGDALQIPRAQAGKANYDAAIVANSTLSPSTVEVKVLGEVRQPGRVIVAPNALFSDALVAAGGLTNEADPKAVQLLRLNRDGTVSRYEIAAVLEQGRDPQKNPSLKKGDLITVPRSFGGGILSTLRDLSPTFFLFNLFNIFR
jgi:polysaccharide biosynthesis/export protein